MCVYVCDELAIRIKLIHPMPNTESLFNTVLHILQFALLYRTLFRSVASINALFLLCTTFRVRNTSLLTTSFFSLDTLLCFCSIL